MRWLIWSVMLLLCGVAWTQERQVVPLRYELWWDERSFWYVGRLEPTAPGEAKLPPLTEPKFFTCEFGGSKRLFVLAKQDGDWALYVDTNGNNDLTDEKPFKLRQRGHNRVFGPIPMKVQMNGRTLIRYVGAEVTTATDGSIRFYLLVASRWKGRLQWDGKTVTVTIVDRDANGLVSDWDVLLWDDGTGQRSLPVLGRLGIDGRFFRFHVAPTGEQLVIEPVQVKSAVVKVQGDDVSLTLEDDDGQWILEGRNGQVLAPVGEFRLVSVTLSREDGQGRKWQLSADAFGPAAPKLSIPESGTTLNLEPLKVSLIWNRKGDEIEFSLDIKTVNGMSVRGLWFNGFQRPPEPKLRLVAAGGKVIDEPKFHYG
ncbi:MAG: hypothetical protein ACK4I8_11520 [Armatimonadota bacterium]